MMHSDMLMFAPKHWRSTHSILSAREYGELDDVTREARAQAKAWKTSRAAIGDRRDVLGVGGRRLS
jgi:hypothetical protein